MNERPIKVAIIDNSLDPNVYTPVAHWSKYFSVPWKAFRAQEGNWPSLKEGFTHFLLTGSEATILEKEKWVSEEMEFIREVVAAGYPLLGSCWGHQLLAVTLVGEGTVRRCHQPEVGWIKIEVAKPSFVLGEAEDFFSFTVHFDEVYRLSEKFEILASTSVCPIQAFQMKGQPVWGIQFHPEIEISEARDLLQRLINKGVPTAEYFQKVLASSPQDSGRIKTIVQRFLAARPRETG
ncbi:type 1 glutamine amidotransferase [Candidatus Aminicenantes bacterium AC-334-K16]|jgi:GMP synthase-like glutamine amidotransferase|nr:type 1 glutamine amidotransferase [Candidatus Aminicenantes bacterium AC-334-K16]